jgi:phosphatidylglycerol:prolipoprotein diacylglycerol transferase
VRPILFEIPFPGEAALAVPAYGVFLVTGFLLAAAVSRRHRTAIGLTGLQVFDLGCVSVLAGVLVSHWAHVLLFPALYRNASGIDWLRVLVPVQGGLIYYGGLAGGAFAIWLYARRRRIPLVDLLDFVAPLGALGLATTRVGCFLNGCCFGELSGLPWAVAYPIGSNPHTAQVALGLIDPSRRALPIHPVQLYETVAALALFAGLWWWAYPRRRFAGEIVSWFGMSYGIWRFGIEFWRADWRTTDLGGSAWTPYQWLSLVVVVFALSAWAVARWVGRSPFRRETG